MDDFSSHSDDYRDLSDAQLKKLQVDKFPHQYAYNFDEPSTKDETYLRRGKKTNNSFNIDSLIGSARTFITRSSLPVHYYLCSQQII